MAQENEIQSKIFTDEKLQYKYLRLKTLTRLTLEISGLLTGASSIVNIILAFL